jgi:hypothetical protein
LISIDNQLKNDGKKYSSYKARVSLKELVYGTKKPTDGNYVIFLALAGGNSAPTITSN